MKKPLVLMIFILCVVLFSACSNSENVVEIEMNDIIEQWKKATVKMLF